MKKLYYVCLLIKINKKMKNCIKAINWKKFLKYELYCLVFLLLCYFSSKNIFPQNFYSIPVIMSLFGLMMIVKGHSIYMIRKKP